MAVLEPSEVKAILALLLFSFLWILLAVPFFATSAEFNSLNPIIQYIVINIGFMGISGIAFGIPFNMFTTKQKNLAKALIKGVMIFFLFSFILDMVQPPYAVSKNGEIISLDPNSLMSAAPDRMWAYIISSIVPGLASAKIPLIDISLLFIAVYIIVPISTALIAALVLSNGEMLKTAVQRNGIHAKP